MLATTLPMAAVGSLCKVNKKGSELIVEDVHQKQVKSELWHDLAVRAFRANSAVHIGQLAGECDHTQYRTRVGILMRSQDRGIICLAELAL